ncbi:MAG: Ig-like domain-containing protein, partial [Verrucomicrobiales bacterium]
MRSRLDLFVRRLRSSFGLLASMVATTAMAVEPVGLWEFENAEDLGSATIGSPLVLEGAVVAASDAAGGGAADVARTSFLTVANPIGPNGSASATRTNQFTLLIDFMVPDFTDGGDDNGNFTGILELNGGGDGDYFIRKQVGVPELGVATITYTGTGPDSSGDGDSGTFRSNTWYRWVYAVDSGGVGRSTYLDGAKIGDNSGNNSIDLARGSLSSTFGIFQDNTIGEQSRALVTTVALYDGRLSDQEISALGSVGSPTNLVPNEAPVISEGETFALPNASYEGEAVTGTLHVSDSDSDVIEWSVAMPAAGGSVEITSSSDSEVSFTYTPSAGFSGEDRFQIEASDGVSSDLIEVTVAVSGPVVSGPSGFWEFDIGSNLAEAESADAGVSLTVVGSDPE